MPVDRKALMKRMKEDRAAKTRTCKTIVYPLPDLKGPGGNAFNLLGLAQRLMKDAGLPDTMYDDFNREATNGDYSHLLDTIAAWFTVAVADVTYIPLPEGADIKTYRGDFDATWDDVDPEDDAEPNEELDEALEDYAANAERDRKIAEVQDKINREVRAELGLEDDDVVIVQVKKAKKK